MTAKRTGPGADSAEPERGRSQRDIKCLSATGAMDAAPEAPRRTASPLPDQRDFAFSKKQSPSLEGSPVPGRFSCSVLSVLITAEHL